MLTVFNNLCMLGIVRFYWHSNGGLGLVMELMNELLEIITPEELYILLDPMGFEVVRKRYDDDGNAEYLLEDGGYQGWLLHGFDLTDMTWCKMDTGEWPEEL